MNELIDAVIDQIHEDIGTGELWPLVELLQNVPVKSLIDFLSADAGVVGAEYAAKFNSLIKE